MLAQKTGLRRLPPEARSTPRKSSQQIDSGNAAQQREHADCDHSTTGNPPILWAIISRAASSAVWFDATVIGGHRLGDFG